MEPGRYVMGSVLAIRDEGDAIPDKDDVEVQERSVGVLEKILGTLNDQTKEKKKQAVEAKRRIEEANLEAPRTHTEIIRTKLKEITYKSPLLSVAGGLFTAAAAGLLAKELIDSVRQYFSDDDKRATTNPENERNVTPNAEPVVGNDAKPIPSSAGDKWIKEMIKRHEGIKLSPYKDTQGYWTIGYGHKIKKGENIPKKITKKQADELFERDYAEHAAGARAMPGFSKFSKAQQGALINLAFNLGPHWWKAKKYQGPAVEALKRGDGRAAAARMRQWLWYSQVGNRGKEVLRLLADGEVPKAERKLAYSSASLDRSTSSNSSKIAQDSDESKGLFGTVKDAVTTAITVNPFTIGSGATKSLQSEPLISPPSSTKTSQKKSPSSSSEYLDYFRP